MKQTSGILVFLLLSFTINAQGWVGNFGTNLTTVDGNGFANPNIKVGIGVPAPTAQLHSNGTVRFEGLSNNNNLSRILAFDASGNLSWRDAATLGSGITPTTFGWGLTGNNADVNNFLGTTNAQPLRLRANNFEYLTISTDGKVGINNTSPDQFSLDVRGSLRLTGIGTRRGLPPAIELMTNMQHGGYLGFRPEGDFAGSYDIIQGGTCSRTTTTNLNFISYPNGTVNCGAQGKIAMSIAHNNFIGINMDGINPNPTANLHVDGSVRFQNLPTGTGGALLIDANGNIVRARGFTGKKPTDTYPTALTSGSDATEINSLRETVNKLEAEVNILKSALRVLAANNSQIADLFKESTMEQNTPNPSSNFTDIELNIVQNFSKATVEIVDMNGNLIKNITVTNSGVSKISLNTQEFSSGKYLYNLVIDGKHLMSKKMVITH